MPFLEKKLATETNKEWIHKFIEYYRSTTVLKPENSHLYEILAQPTSPFSNVH